MKHIFVCVYAYLRSDPLSTARWIAPMESMGAMSNVHGMDMSIAHLIFCYFYLILC
jgi:hypothetical protein